MRATFMTLAFALLAGCGVKSFPKPPAAATPETADGGRAACAPNIAPAVTEAGAADASEASR